MRAIRAYSLRRAPLPRFATRAGVVYVRGHRGTLECKERLGCASRANERRDDRRRVSETVDERLNSRRTDVPRFTSLFSTTFDLWPRTSRAWTLGSRPITPCDDRRWKWRAHEAPGQLFAKPGTSGERGEWIPDRSQANPTRVLLSRVSRERSDELSKACC